MSLAGNKTVPSGGHFTNNFLEMDRVVQRRHDAWLSTPEPEADHQAPAAR